MLYQYRRLSDTESLSRMYLRKLQFECFAAIGVQYIEHWHNRNTFHIFSTQFISTLIHCRTDFKHHYDCGCIASSPQRPIDSYQDSYNVKCISLTTWLFTSFQSTVWRFYYTLQGTSSSHLVLVAAHGSLQTFCILPYFLLYLTVYSI